MRYVPRSTTWYVTGYPWSDAEADGVMRIRLRIVGVPAEANDRGLVAVGYTLNVLPTTPTGQETPIARTACLISLN